MDVHITARHFKAHQTLKDYAKESAEKLEKYYSGIVRTDIILSYEKAVNSIKVAEFHVTVYGTILIAISKSDDFIKSIDKAIGKIDRQLKRYKSKQREKKKKVIRRTQAKP